MHCLLNVINVYIYIYIYIYIYTYTPKRNNINQPKLALYYKFLTEKREGKTGNGTAIVLKILLNTQKGNKTQIKKEVKN